MNSLWYDVPWLVALVALLWYVLPPSKVGGKLSTRLRLVDWAGLAISIAAVVLLMIPLSKGGSTFAWNSSIVISMLTVGAVALVLFVAVEWKFAALPIMPCKFRFLFFMKRRGAPFILFVTSQDRAMTRDYNFALFICVAWLGWALSLSHLLPLSTYTLPSR